MRFLLLVTITAAERMTAYDNFGDGSLKFGSEELSTDFITLDSGNKTASLPAFFTICNSVWIKYWPTAVLFFQIYQDHQPW